MEVSDRIVKLEKDIVEYAARQRLGESDWVVHKYEFEKEFTYNGEGFGVWLDYEVQLEDGEFCLSDHEVQIMMNGQEVVLVPVTWDGWANGLYCKTTSPIADVYFRMSSRNFGDDGVFEKNRGVVMGTEDPDGVTSQTIPTGTVIKMKVTIRSSRPVVVTSDELFLIW